MAMDFYSIDFLKTFIFLFIFVNILDNFVITLKMFAQTKFKLDFVTKAQTF